MAWSVVLLLLLLARKGQLGDLRAALRPGRTLAMLAAASALIAVNWGVYIWAILAGRVMEGSLGYFINPLVNVGLGLLVLGERLERPVGIAVAVASLGVVWLTVGLGHLPWVSLSLAFSFGAYGLLRKLVPVGALLGLCVETLLLLPFALGYLAWAAANGRLAFASGNLRLDILLVLAGPITAVPLLFFAAAARRLPLSTLGLPAVPLAHPPARAGRVRLRRTARRRAGRCLCLHLDGPGDLHRALRAQELGEDGAGGRPLTALCAQGALQDAVAPAVREVDHRPAREPGQEGEPGSRQEARSSGSRRTARPGRAPAA